MQSTRYTVSFHGRLFEVEAIKNSILKGVRSLGISGDAITFLSEPSWDARDGRSPHIVLFFGSLEVQPDGHPALTEAIEESILVIPVTRSLDNFEKKVPATLRGINGFELDNDEAVNALASVVLENFGLLRKSRRLFISYRRKESASIAMQLYEFLDGKGFRVFLDIRGIRPGIDFQTELWHSLADSDVVVLLDTPNFRESEWTRLELERAYETNVQILHLLWPGVKPSKSRALSNFYFLSFRDFRWRGFLKHKALGPRTLTRIAGMVEALRARALASRQRYLTDQFCDVARDLAQSVFVQPNQYIEWSNGKRSLAVFPAVGVPDALRVEDIEGALQDSGADGVRILFDERGITPRWLNHLDWLNVHFPTQLVRASYLQELMEEDRL